MPEGVTSPVELIAETTVLNQLPVPAKEGYRFIGWELKVVSGEGEEQTVSYVAITETTVFHGPARTVELIARYVEQTRKTVITFIAESGTINGEATKSIDAGTAIGTLPTATTSVAGEAFGGWLTADGKLVDETTVFAADVTAITLTASFGWNGEAVSESLSGEGTEEAPYLISSGADLAYLASSVNGGNNYSGKYIVLTKNVNMNFKAWTSIGKTSDKVFSGIFDGKNFAVENVTDAFIEYASGATVKNLTCGSRWTYQRNERYRLHG